MMNARCLFADIGDIDRGFRLRMCANPDGDGLEFLSGTLGQPVRQPLGRHGSCGCGKRTVRRSKRALAVW